MPVIDPGEVREELDDDVGPCRQGDIDMQYLSRGAAVRVFATTDGHEPTTYEKTQKAEERAPLPKENNQTSQGACQDSGR